MSTAPDLPAELLASGVAVPAAVPAQERRVPLALVPAPDEGDLVDFEEALRSATPRLQRYATRRLQDAHEAEEVVQEALLRAFQHRDTLRTGDELMAWLTVVTGRLVIDRVRVRGRMTPVAELPAGTRTGRDTADVVVARDEARMALDALEAMPARQASVLWAREVEGLSYDEISDRFGLSEPTVRSLLHRARRTLRREYAERGGTLPTLGLVALAPWLQGLRVAGRLRDVARRAAGATAATATGLAVATLVPLWTHPAPAHAQPHAAAPALVTKSDAEPSAPAPSRGHEITPQQTSGAPTTTAVSVVAASGHQPVPLPHPDCATTHDAGINCSAPAGPELYVKLPGRNAVGVSSDIVPLDCTALPATPVTHCELPSDRKH